MEKQLAAGIYADILESMGQGVVVLRPDASAGHRLVYCNREAARLGLAAGDGPLPDALSALARATAAGAAQAAEVCRPTAEGNSLWLSLRSFPLADGGVGVLAADVTAAREAERRTAEEATVYRVIAENSDDCLCLHDDTGMYLYVSPSIGKLLGYEPSEMCGRTPFDFVHPDDERAVLEPFRRLLLAGTATASMTARFRHKDGSYRWLESAVSVVEDCPLPEVRYHSSTRDVTERKALEKRLTEMGYRDSLTGLYNRGFFEEELKRLNRRREGSVGLIIVDVDDLKLVNDALGHEAGDEVLRRTARALALSFRGGDLIARIGGDEFAVLMEDVSLEDVREAGRRVVETAAADNLSVAGATLSLSLGYAVGTDTATTMQELYRAADDNMYRSRLYRGKSHRAAIVNMLKRLLTERDFANEEHANRLEGMAVGLGRAAGLSEERLGDLALFAQFHDIGKVGVPDALLSKPGPLTPAERKKMERHCDVGYRIASASSELMPIADWILRHHEWWNGQGYPLGLKGEEIPLECRVLAIVDAYDAMTSDRPYRKALSPVAALAELERCAGSQFDPRLVALFVEFDLQG